LKNSSDLVDLHYLGYAYERSGNEKEAAKAFDRSFRSGYKEFIDGIILRSSFKSDREPPNDKLSVYLENYSPRIVVTALSARRSLDLKGPSSKGDEWMTRAQMLTEIGRILASDQLVYSAREIDVDAKIGTKPSPGYSDEARRNSVQGTIELLVLFDVDGRTKGAIATKSLPHGLTERAYAAARRITFDPGQRAGKPVAMLKAMSYSFSIY
jgi:hypothetical protein